MLTNVPVQKKLDLRVKRTRGLIQRAFIELLAEKGFREITVQDIAERAEINRATFYAHYPDKYALLEESVRRQFRQELEKRTLSACHYSEENLHALVMSVCEFVAQSSEHCKASEPQFDSLVEMQVRKQVQELIEMWLAQIGSQSSPQIAAVATSWAIYGLALEWSRARNRLPVEAYARQVLPLVISNLQLKQGP